MQGSLVLLKCPTPAMCVLPSLNAKDKGRVESESMAQDWRGLEVSRDWLSAPSTLSVSSQRGQGLKEAEAETHFVFFNIFI